VSDAATITGATLHLASALHNAGVDSEKMIIVLPEQDYWKMVRHVIAHEVLTTSKDLDTRYTICKLNGVRFVGL
jgi:hypothetical protein